jgi:hypothetical protein
MKRRGSISAGEKPDGQLGKRPSAPGGLSANGLDQTFIPRAFGPEA